MQGSATEVNGCNKQAGKKHWQVRQRRTRVWYKSQKCEHRSCKSVGQGRTGHVQDMSTVAGPAQALSRKGMNGEEAVLCVWMDESCKRGSVIRSGWKVVGCSHAGQ